MAPMRIYQENDDNTRRETSKLSALKDLVLQNNYTGNCAKEHEIYICRGQQKTNNL